MQCLAPTGDDRPDGAVPRAAAGRVHALAHTLRCAPGGRREGKNPGREISARSRGIAKSIRPEPDAGMVAVALTRGSRYRTSYRRTAANPSSVMIAVFSCAASKQGPGARRRALRNYAASAAALVRWWAQISGGGGDGTVKTCGTGVVESGGRLRNLPAGRKPRPRRLETPTATRDRWLGPSRSPMRAVARPTGVAIV